MESGTWTWFDHTADVGLEVSAPSLEALFSTSAMALFDLLIETGATTEDQTPNEHAITLHAANPPELLVRWLSELLYLHETADLVFRRLQVTHLSDDHLIGVVIWEPFDRARHRIKREIKGVTYHQVSVVEEPAGWRARVILDV